MNKKQFISMWLGITAIVLVGLTVIQNYGLLCPYGFVVWVVITILITGGLIYTFRENRQKAKNTIQDIRDNLLKRKQFKIKKDSRKKDK